MEKLEKIFGNQGIEIEEAKVLLLGLMSQQKSIDDVFLMYICAEDITKVREKYERPHPFGFSRILSLLGEHGYVEISGGDNKKYFMTEESKRFFEENYMVA